MSGVVPGPEGQTFEDVVVVLDLETELVLGLFLAKHLEHVNKIFLVRLAGQLVVKFEGFFLTFHGQTQDVRVVHSRLILHIHHVVAAFHVGYPLEFVLRDRHLVVAQVLQQLDVLFFLFGELQKGLSGGLEGFVLAQFRVKFHSLFFFACPAWRSWAVCRRSASSALKSSSASKAAWWR